MYRVTIIADRYAVEALQDGQWIVLGTYDDPAVASEIVLLANNVPGDNSFDGRRPDSAVPFSAFEGIEEWL